MKCPLTVRIWDMEVGRLAWDERKRNSYFYYSPDFLKRNLDIAPLEAPVMHCSPWKAIYGETERKYQRLPPFLADSLPDSWGNQLFELWRQKNHYPAASITPLDKLSFIGKRGMGALEFEPERSFILPGKSERIDVESLVTLAQRIFSERERVRIEPGETLTAQALIAVGTSAGGRQPKALLAIDRETGEIRSGQIPDLANHEYCLVKFGDAHRSSAELEMVFYDLCRKAGICMTESRLIETEGQKHFLTDRFDRTSTGEKLHVQTAAALSPDTDSYEKLFSICHGMKLPHTEIEELYRRMVFNVLANNTDDHDKNFSFTMDRKGNWSLSPAYDMTFIFNTGGYLPQEERCMMIGEKLRNITKQDVIDLGCRCGLTRNTAEKIIDSVSESLLTLRETAEKYGVREEWTGRVESCIFEKLREWDCISGPAAFGNSVLITEDGRRICNAKIEPQHKGNFRITAEIDGKEWRAVIRPKHREYGIIMQKGLANLTDDDLFGFIRAIRGNEIQHIKEDGSEKLKE